MDNGDVISPPVFVSMKLNQYHCPVWCYEVLIECQMQWLVQHISSNDFDPPWRQNLFANLNQQQKIWMNYWKQALPHTYLLSHDCKLGSRNSRPVYSSPWNLKQLCESFEWYSKVLFTRGFGYFLVHSIILCYGKSARAATWLSIVQMLQIAKNWNVHRNMGMGEFQ